jgi:hypothetical protein
MGLKVSTVSGSTTLDASHNVVLASGTITINLPDASGIAGRVYTIKNTGSGTVTIDPSGSQTIDGAATLPLPQYQYRMIVSDGSNWAIIGQ